MSVIHIEVRLFAMQRAQTGVRSHALDLSPDADVAAAWAALVKDFPVIAPARSSVRFARNGRYVGLDEPLAEGDELAVIPPVAGGVSDHDAVVRRIEIVERSLDEGLLAELRSEVASDADGAVAIFIGQTRETPGTPAAGQEEEAARYAGERVEGLAYEAFESMALAVLDEVADEIEGRFGVRRMAILHRVGEVGVGESSVVIVTASPHRDEAFSACRYAIEELKARVPIWKAERFVGGQVWMGAPPRSGPDPSGPDPKGEDQAGSLPDRR